MNRLITTLLAMTVAIGTSGLMFAATIS